MSETASEQSKELRLPPRTWVLWICIFGGIILLMLARERMDRPGETLSQSGFQRLVDSNLIASATINYNPQNAALTEIYGKYYKTDAQGNRIKSGDEDATAGFRAKVRLSSELEYRLLRNPNIDVSEPNTMLMSVIWSVLPILVIAALIWFFFIRQIRRIARNSPSTAASR